MAALAEERNDEERIIENMLLDGRTALYEDLDFLPTRQSLYNSEKMIPEYDDEVFQRITWCRPREISEMAAYFDQYTKALTVAQGTLPDEVFLGTLLAVGVYSKYDLIQNIFASRPEDFSKFGVYTCRFYVDGEWVEVITDTLLPCLRDNASGTVLPAYGRSTVASEMWIPMVQKAFAKAMGSYEAMTSIKVQKALLHLTGGSVQLRNLRDDVTYMDSISDQMAWQEFKRKVTSDCLILMLPQERKTTDGQLAQDGMEAAAAMADGSDRLNDHFFIPNRLYSVVLCRDHGGYELVLMHCPWSDPNYIWTGEWSDSSNDWDLYPELLYELEKDPSIPWTRRNPNGYFWIAFRQMIKFFNKLYQCQLFPSEKYSFYCARGECRGPTAGGPLQTIRDKDEVLTAATASRNLSLQKSTAAVVVDGDPSWFTNPQYRIHCNGPTTLFVSCIPLGSGEEGDDVDQYSMYLTVCRSPRHASSPISTPSQLWDVSQFEVHATDRVENGPLHVKGQETSIWSVQVDHKSFYYVIPNTSKRSTACEFILRVFASKPVVVEAVAPLPRMVEKGEWKRVGEIDTTGGPPMLTSSDGSAPKPNPKWCQNPQYHLQIADPYGKDEVFLKIVLRKVDPPRKSKGSHHASGSAAQAVDAKKSDATLGLVLCKASVLEDNLPKAFKKAPRQNKLGEPIPPKASSLKKRGEAEVVDPAKASHMPVKTILRTLTLDPAEYHLSTSFLGKHEACVFYPKLPRAWLPNGLIVTPCLSEKGARNHFEMEIFSSEKVLVNALPETYSRSMAGEWNESCAGGSHICSAHKKNPKFLLRFHNPVNTDAPARLRITLARTGTNWRAMAKKDTVGCMIGFYIFHVQGAEQTLIYESTFVPDDELSTDPSFSLPQLAHGDMYAIMPTTFHEGKFGAFVLSILSEYEFHLAKDK